MVQLLTVTTVCEANPQELSSYTGVIEPVETVIIRCQTSGTIENAMSLGTYVREGELTFKLSNPKLAIDLQSAEAELEALRHREEFFEIRQNRSNRDEFLPEIRRLEEKRDYLVASARTKKGTNLVKRLRQEFRELSHKAPFDAVMINRHVSPGAFVETGDKLGTLASTKSLKMVFQTNSELAPNLGTLMNVCHDRECYSLPVSNIYPANQLGQYSVEIRVPSEHFRIGLVVSASQFAE